VAELKLFYCCFSQLCWMENCNRIWTENLLKLVWRYASKFTSSLTSVLEGQHCYVCI